MSTASLVSKCLSQRGDRKCFVIRLPNRGNRLTMLCWWGPQESDLNDLMNCALISVSLRKPSLTTNTPYRDDWVEEEVRISKLHKEVGQQLSPKFCLGTFYVPPPSFLSLLLSHMSQASHLPHWPSVSLRSMGKTTTENRGGKYIGCRHANKPTQPTCS